MKAWPLVTMMLVGAFIPLGHAQAADPALEAALQGRYEAMRVAMASRDAPSVAALLAPDFVSVDVQGRSETAQDMIAEVTALKPDPNKISTTRLSDVRLAADTATLEQRYDMKSTRVDEAGLSHPIEIVARSTDSWVRRAGVWLMQRTVTRELSVFRDGQLVSHQLSPPG